MLRGQLVEIISGTVFVFIGLTACAIAAIRRRSGVRLLIVHNERQSRKSNELEADIFEAILAAGAPQPQASIGIVTPHRAHRTLLTSRIGQNAAVDVVDTVERLQGGERPTIIVSATASDSAAISANAEFVLDLNRSNVAFSRAQARLIVVCSESLLDHIPAELDQYDMIPLSSGSLASDLHCSARI